MIDLATGWLQEAFQFVGLPTTPGFVYAISQNKLFKINVKTGTMALNVTMPSYARGLATDGTWLYRVTDIAVLQKIDPGANDHIVKETNTFTSLNPFSPKLKELQFKHLSLHETEMKSDCKLHCIV